MSKIREDNKLLSKIDAIVKLLCMQVKPQVEGLKKELLKTSQQKKAYKMLDAKKSIKEIARLAGYSNSRTLEKILPEWERKGLILSIGKGTNKKYINIENLEV